jgi:hypothetical protein
MIRSRSIPLVLSRVAGDGIHAILLIDNDGELLGSYGSPPPPRPSQGETNVNVGEAPHTDLNHWPLDAASIGALISEVAGDYRRMGEDLLLLDPPNYSQRQGVGSGGGGVGSSSRRRGQLLPQQDEQDGSSRGGEDGGSSSLQRTGLVGKTSNKDKSDSETNLKSLVVELDYVSSFFVRCCHLYLKSLLSSRGETITITRGSLVWLALGLAIM